MTESTSKTLKKLSELEKEEGKLPLLLEFYRKLLKTQSGAKKTPSTPPPGLSREAIQRRLQQGKPLVGFDDMNLDWDAVRALFVSVIAAFAEYPKLFGEIPEKLQKPEAGRLLTKKAVKAWLDGGELPPTLLDGVSNNLMQAILQATLHPFLAGYARSLAKSVAEVGWRRGYCPVCGGTPDLAFLEKEVGARWLVCSRCDAEWNFQRLECPYCNNMEQTTLSFFTNEDEVYRLYVCEECRCYLKAVDLRKAGEVSLPLERLYTMDLDNQARERGYRPGIRTPKRP